MMENINERLWLKKGKSATRLLRTTLAILSLEKIIAYRKMIGEHKWYTWILKNGGNAGRLLRTTLADRSISWLFYAR